MNLLVIGAGRMGQRHLRGVGAVEGEIHVVDPRPEAEEEVAAIFQEIGAKGVLRFHRTLDQVPTRKGYFEAAISATTAEDRLGQVRFLAETGVARVLLEKPLEQSRARLKELHQLLQESRIKARCNLYFRALPLFRSIHPGREPFWITVAGGAQGFACASIHWMDFAVYLNEGKKGKMLFSEIDSARVASGRGAQFRDYGGNVIYGFEQDSRLFLSFQARSSAPINYSLVMPHRHVIMDQQVDRTVWYERNPASTLPNYRVGGDYEELALTEKQSCVHWENTAKWLMQEDSAGLPTVEEAIPAHEMLFDLLETTGESHFPIT